MAKWTIGLIETVTYDVEVEADNEEEAMEAATEMWANSADPTHDFCGQGQGVEVGCVTEEEPEPHGPPNLHTRADIRCALGTNIPMYR